MNQSQAAILRTLAYADVFDYPLTASEIWQFLISKEKRGQEKIFKEMAVLKKEKRVKENRKFFHLPGRKEVIALRKKRKRWSRRKLIIARRTARWLRLIPFVKMVTVTGNLAMLNSDQDDDIDFLIVTTRGRLWFTRLLAVLLVELISSRRRPKDKKVKDKICLNMFLDEAHLGLPKKERDLFSAHEVCQLKVLWEKKHLYQAFLAKNQWIKDFLPNWKP